jgi:fido (protein-threonine AMPylation protein)
MPSIEQKNINGKLFFYLSEQIRLKKIYKKIQVYLGKSIPKDLRPYYGMLMDKEIELISTNLPDIFAVDKILDFLVLKKIEELKVKWKYFELSMSEFKKEQFWNKFAIQFIFESNAIEGSKLSEKEVSSITMKKNIKKSLDRKEIQEVLNSLRAFEYLHNGDFKFNQRNIIKLHSILTENLDISAGYKKVEIVVNNKQTSPPGSVRTNMANLISWFNSEKKTNRHPLLVFADFHQKFEKIHPFEDGNGRTGRLLFNWMLLNSSYPPILFRKKNSNSYFSSLSHADDVRKIKWYMHVVNVYKRTVRTYLEG